MTTAEVKAELDRRLDATHRKTGVIGSAEHLRHVPKIKCTDGFEMSVQASAFHYCLPRDSAGPWVQVEIGYPTQKVEAFMPFAEDADRPTETVYGYVPLDVVVETIVEHGGFAS